MVDDHSAYQVPKSDEEALARFRQFEHHDPLPDVPAALLNAGDIFDYARITGMIWPFEKDEQRLKQKLKSASYEIDFLGDIYFADENGRQTRIEIKHDTPFILPKNSIAFVFLATQFRLPDYIALRFNLKITHVHRGLLLGTGPLIDPGFAGRLLIPLHNLTSKDYTLTGGDGLIWVEFTKLSPNSHWNTDARKSTRDYEHFPPSKRNLERQRYFNRASSGIPAISSIPGEVRISRDSAERARDAAEKAQTYTRNLTIGGAIILFVSLVAMLVPTWDLISSANKNVADANNTVRNLREEQISLEKRIEALQSELRSLRESQVPSSSSAPTNAKIDKAGTQRSPRSR
jgi:deoxycytidine triphosphate deaminase